MTPFDVCVIGAGPAGLMAAIASSAAGARVILIEKNPEAGEKLLLTGKGRCNLAHAVKSKKEIIEAFRENGRFLHSALSRFGLEETLDFFASLRLSLKTERGNRVFPSPDNAQDVRNRLMEAFHQSGGIFRGRSPVADLTAEDGKITGAVLHGGSTIEAGQFIVTTGGLSYPRTGSTGDGYRWAKAMGHTVNETIPALVPVRLADEWIPEVSGLSLKNVRLTLFTGKTESESRFGDLDFTPFGISGPIGMDLSRAIGKALRNNRKTSLSLDLKPAMDAPMLDKRLLRELDKTAKGDFGTVLKALLPRKLIVPFARLCSIRIERKAATLTKKERLQVLRLLKALPLKPLSLLGFEWSLVTSGGIALDEVDPRTMASKLVENLYFAGEILDLDAPTGGYNLQACWTTGHVAGVSAAYGAPP
ncbi:MAG: NAD(P)/FAD-dependent oxidoreductase [Thermovirgaceae bacterium]